MARSHAMTAKRRAALRKAQAASARKRRGRGHGKLAAAHRSNDSTRRRIRKTGKAVAAGAAIGAIAYGAYRGRKTIDRNVRAAARSAARTRVNARRIARDKAENNAKVREYIVAGLMEKYRNRAGFRRPQVGLRVAKRYRLGRADVRRKRKAKKYG